MSSLQPASGLTQIVISIGSLTAAAGVKGERDWYARHGLSPGAIDPEIVPYYLLLIGPPDLIPFEFQYLLGVDYAIGRLSFDAPEDYERYARSTVAYESARSVPNGKEISLLGHAPSGRPRHRS